MLVCRLGELITLSNQSIIIIGVMSMKNWVAGIGLLCLLASCNDGDGRDETILDMSYLTGKNWYYNAWLGDPEGLKSQDLLEVVRFEKGGTLKNIEFGGRREFEVGTWTSDGNRIELNYNNAEAVVWNVQRSGDDYIETIVNATGKREYSSELKYLGDLTADAFLVNDYSVDGQYKTHIGVDVRGNRDLREVRMLLEDGHVCNLKNYEYYWAEKENDHVGEAKKQEVRFYFRIGKDKHLKLRDSIYNDNLPMRTNDEMDIMTKMQSSTLSVSWDAYERDDIYYRIEILPVNGKIVNPYFVSRIQSPGTQHIDIKATTAGEVNRLSELQSGESYMIRLSALLYEPGIDPWNDNYGYANIQAVSYFTKKFVWE